MFHSLQSESYCEETPPLCCQSAAFCNEGAVFCYRHPCHFKPLLHALDRKLPDHLLRLIGAEKSPRVANGLSADTEDWRRFRSCQDYALDCSARAEYIVPPNGEGRIVSFSTRSTPAPVKSWRSLSKPTGYGPHLFGLDRSYSTIKKRSVTDGSLLINACWS
jgi:hypothetical protein